MPPGGDDQPTRAEARDDHRAMLRFLALNAGFGILIGMSVAALLFLLDIQGLGTRLANARHPVLPALLITAPLALTFGAAVAASAIMLMPYKTKKDLE